MFDILTKNACCAGILAMLRACVRFVCACVCVCVCVCVRVCECVLSLCVTDVLCVASAIQASLSILTACTFS